MSRPGELLERFEQTLWFTRGGREWPSWYRRMEIGYAHRQYATFKDDEHYALEIFEAPLTFFTSDVHFYLWSLSRSSQMIEETLPVDQAWARFEQLLEHPELPFMEDVL